MMPTGAAEDDSAPEDRITDRYRVNAAVSDSHSSFRIVRSLNQGEQQLPGS
jgi:hypothetical protein